MKDYKKVNVLIRIFGFFLIGIVEVFTSNPEASISEIIRLGIGNDLYIIILAIHLFVLMAAFEGINSLFKKKKVTR